MHRFGLNHTGMCGRRCQSLNTTTGLAAKRASHKTAQFGDIAAILAPYRHYIRRELHEMLKSNIATTSSEIAFVLVPVSFAQYHTCAAA